MSSVLKTIRSPGGDLVSLDEKTGKPLETRLLDAASARSIYETHYNADRTSAYNRSQIQRMMDGDPPYSDAELMAAGQGYRCNINFDEGGELLEKSLAAYIDLNQSVEVLTTGRTNFGDSPDQVLEYSQAVMLAFSNMVTGWSQYFTRFMTNATNYVTHGVSFGVYEDSIDWRFDFTQFGDFVIPRGTAASEDDIEIAFRRKEYQVHELYAKIENPEVAAKMGWDVEMTRKAILMADNGYQHGKLNDWESWQAKAKNNDLFMSARAMTVEVLHCWVRELNGKVSHFILTEQPISKDFKLSGNEDFLFRRLEEFDSMASAFTSFVYGVGTNGEFHGIRGLGYKVFPHVQISNRLNCQVVDGAMLSSSLLLQPKDSYDMSQLAMSYMGAYAVLSPGLEPVATSTPNFAQNAVPVIDRMKSMIRSKTGQYMSTDALPEKGDMSRFEASTRVQERAGLTLTNLVLFYQSFDRLLTECFRRASRKDYAKQLPGGEAVHAMRQELTDKGIPLEALYQFDVSSIRATRATGAGSAAARDEIFRELTDISPSFDEIGKKRLSRDRVASKLGSYQEADRYTPAVEETRLPIDAKIAELENNQMFNNIPVEVLGNELHMTHLQMHTDRIAEVIKGVEEGTVDQMQVTEPLLLVHEHSEAHLQLVQGDPVTEHDAAYYRQVLQQSGEIIMNGMRMLQAQQQDQAQAAAAEGGQPDPQQADHIQKLQMRAQEFAQKMEQLQKEHALTQQLKISEAETKRAIASADAASKLKPSTHLPT